MLNIYILSIKEMGRLYKFEVCIYWYLDCKYVGMFEYIL